MRNDRADINQDEEQLQALLTRLKKQDPNILCPQGKQVVKMCLNQNCPNSLRCDLVDCQSCGVNVHSMCLASLSLSSLIQLLNKNQRDRRHTMHSIIKAEEEHSLQLKRNRKCFSVRFLLGSLSEEQSFFIDKIFTDKNYSALSGRQANSLCNRLQANSFTLINQMNEREVREEEQRIQQFSLELREFNREVEATTEKCFVSGGELWKSKVLKLMQLRGNERILSSIKFIIKELGNPKGLKLLFRASDHNFKAQYFHTFCDNIEDTLVLLRTQYGKTIAGFTHHKWDKTTRFAQDSAKRAFLLQLNLRQRMVHTASDNCTIYCDAEHGPYFGGGGDLVIGDNCSTNRASSFANFPRSYNYDGPNKYQQSQESFKAFSGAVEGFNFKVEEYEVYRVLY